MKTPSLKAVGSRVGKLAACIALGMAAVSQTARSAPSYSAAVLADSPLAFWQLNDTGDPSSGTLSAADSSGHGYNGLYGTDSQNAFDGILAPQPPAYQGFALNQGALQSAVGDLTSAVTIPPLNLGTNTVTIAMWINPSTSGEVNYTGLLFNRTTAGDAAGFGFGANPDATGMPALGYTWNQNSGSTWGWNSGLHPVGGMWQFTALVISSNSATVYLYYMTNGQPVLLSAVNPIAHTAQAFSGGGTFLGSDVNQGNTAQANNVFAGQISGAAVWNSSLTASNILALFAAGVGVQGFPPQITTQPLNPTYAFAGSPAQVSVSGVNGSSPFSYEWTLNGTNVNSLGDQANFAGANSSALTILNMAARDAGTYVLTITNSVGKAISSNAVVIIQSQALVGEWLTNNTLADVSGYSPAGKHDGFDITGAGDFTFTTDVPPHMSGYSVLFSAGDDGIGISNSATGDNGYTPTFDNQISQQFTVICWAKNMPTTWSPFVSKFGETEAGWQLREDGTSAGNEACFTVRDGSVGELTNGPSWTGNNPFNNPDDMATRSFPSADGNWHNYAGVYNSLTGIRTLFVDGNVVAQEVSNVVYSLAPAQHLCIGAKDSPIPATGSEYSNFGSNNMAIYDVRLYNYALTGPQIQQIVGILPPSIGGQPSSVSAFPGTTVQLVASGISGTPPLSYQWQLGASNLTDNITYTGSASNVLTIANVTTNAQGTYRLIVTNFYGKAISSNATFTIVYPSLVGEWIGGTSVGTFRDISGYSAPGTHDGTAVGGANYLFTNDVPPYFPGQALNFPNGDTGILISNSATSDANYTSTYDAGIANSFTVAVWEKGTFNLWSTWWPWVSKYGDNGLGWQMRADQAGQACWTVRDNNAGTMVMGSNLGWDGNDDLNSGIGVDGLWHQYVGTYNAKTGVRYLYIDGVVYGYETGNVAYNQAPGSHVAIGLQDQGGGNYTGFDQSSIELYDARIWNYDLSAAQVTALQAPPANSPAEIGVEPTNVTTTCEGVTVQIAAQSGGGAPITNRWWFNGAKLVDGNYNGVVVSGSASDVLTIANVTTNWDGVYYLTAMNGYGSATSSNATLTVGTSLVAPPPAGSLVGSWLTGAPNLADHSGYSPAGTHDAYVQSGTTFWTNDVPPIAARGAYSLSFNNAGLVVSNSSSLDANYTDTYDVAISNSMTVVCWAKGYPGGWNPWVSKYGENSLGWQLRVNNSLNPTWTVRGTGGNDDMQATITTDDGNWHFYAGTYDVTSGNRNLYVDGFLAATEGANGQYAVSPPSHLMIGGKDSGGNSFGNYFTGEIYGVGIYNTALSDVQVSSLMVSQTPVFNGPAIVSTGPNGKQMVLSWNTGTLLQATNLTGPWVPSGATSPYTNTLQGSVLFFKLSNP